MAKEMEKDATQEQTETKSAKGETSLRSGEEIKNIVNITDAGPCKKKVSIEIPAEKITNTLDEQYKKLGMDTVVPGFRKGRAPRRLLEKRFGKEIGEQTKLQLLADASQAAVKDSNLDVLGDPDIDHEKIELPKEGPLKFEFEIEIRPEFELPSLEGIPVEKPRLAVTDDTVENEITELRKRLGTWKPKEGKIVAEDQVIADVVLKPLDGEVEKIENTEIYAHHRGIVGKVPVDGLDELLVGAKAGDIKTTAVDVPATFYDEKYRGKKVDVEIKINDVKELELAKLDENFFKRFGTANKEELTKLIRQRHEADVERHQKEAMRQSIRNYLLEKVSFDLPANIVADQSRDLLQRQYTRLLMQGVKMEEIQKQMEQLKSSSDEQANVQLKSFFVMDAVAKKLDIKTTEEEINGYIAQAAMYRQTRPEKLREQMSRDGSLAQAALEIRENKCIDKILETAKITEVEPAKLEAKLKKAEHKPASGEQSRTTKKAAPKVEKKEEKPKEEKLEKKADKPKEKKEEKAEHKKAEKKEEPKKAEKPTRKAPPKKTK
ncbi:MAG: trigger factor [Sedimentisphaerales bacterium]